MQSFLETFTVDSRLLQLKTFLIGRVRMRVGYAWGENPSAKENGAEGVDLLKEGDVRGAAGDPASSRGTSGGPSGRGDDSGASGKTALPKTPLAENGGPQLSRERPQSPPPASALWDAGGRNGRPMGIMIEGPFASDSFLVGFCLFGDDFKFADRLPAPSLDGEQYAYTEHSVFRAWEEAFPDFNLPLVPTAGVRERV